MLNLPLSLNREPMPFCHWLSLRGRTVEIIEPIEFFFQPGSAALRIREHNYTVIVLT